MINNYFRYLFLFRRRPDLRISLDAKLPEGEALIAYLEHNQFATNASLARYAPVAPVIEADLNDLNQVLIPAFFEIDQQARYWENRFYSGQWRFGLGMVFIPVLLSLIMYISFSVKFDQLNAVARGYQSTTIPDIFTAPVIPTVVGVLTLLMIIFTLVVLIRDARDEPQKKWAKARQAVEEYRATYFKYLSHLYPFEDEDRYVKLREAITRIRFAEPDVYSNASLPPFQELKPRAAHAGTEIRVLANIYLTLRVANRLAFYQSRLREAEINLDFANSAVQILFLVALITTFLRIVYADSFALLIALISLTYALGLMFFREAYGWDRLRTIYREAYTQFQKVYALTSIIEAEKSDTKLNATHRQIVLDSEGIILSEAGQFGQQVGLTVSDTDQTALKVSPIFGAPQDADQFRCDIFMIMPFRSQFENVYRLHIRGALQDANYVIRRGDDFHSKEGVIMEEVWSAIYNAKLVIVECTIPEDGTNANVYYELGIAHTLGKPAILITQNIAHIPFDLRLRRILQYENSEAGLLKFSEQLVATVKLLL
jgi:hypothetical protein